MESIDKKIIINEAAKAALIFGLISVAYLLCAFLLNDSIAGSIVMVIFRLAKLVGLIWLMRALMVKLKNKYAGVGRKELVRYGTYIALFSAIIVACGDYLCYNVIFPNEITEMMNGVYEQLAPLMDSNSLEVLSNTESYLASIQTISDLIYCFLYGWVLSLILAPRICPTDIFSEKNTPFEQ
ncbi:MAG: DUF4199 domain-containing protein [Candidatus Cryptobacteroides sp.]